MSIYDPKTNAFVDRRLGTRHQLLDPYVSQQTLPFPVSCPDYPSGSQLHNQLRIQQI
jgi:hypothetical protein